MALCQKLKQQKTSDKQETPLLHHAAAVTAAAGTDACRQPNAATDPLRQSTIARSGSTLARRVLSLFRSRSDPTVPVAQPPSPPRRRRTTGPTRSSSASPCSSAASLGGSTTGARRGSGGQAGKSAGYRRRYQRVVRNENAKPPELPDDNLFVVRKFTQEYLTNYYAEKKPIFVASPPSPSRVNATSGCSSSGTSHPILKNRLSANNRNASGSTDDETTSSSVPLLLPLMSPTSSSTMAMSTASSSSTTAAPPLTPTNRHTKFRDVVEIVEYQLRDRVNEKLHNRTVAVRLNDSDEEPEIADDACAAAAVGRQRRDGEAEADAATQPKRTESTTDDDSNVSCSECRDGTSRPIVAFVAREAEAASAERRGSNVAVTEICNIFSPLSSPGHRCRSHVRMDDDDCDHDAEDEDGDERDRKEEKGAGAGKDGVMTSLSRTDDKEHILDCEMK